MFSDLEKNGYWMLLDKCLREFHGYAPETSIRAVCYYRDSLERRVFGLESADIIYHEEPFALACELSGKELSLSDYLQKYDQLIFEIEQQEEIQRLEFNTEYEQSDLESLFLQVYNSYCLNEAKIGDFEFSPKIDIHLYNRVLASVAQIGYERETNSPFYYAPSPFEAAIFLMDKQHGSRSIHQDNVSRREIGEAVKLPLSKLVFRTQSNDSVDFQPNLWSMDSEHKHHSERFLAAFCFLLKSVTEYNVPSVSIQALIEQAVAFEVGIPTALLDWTSNPAEAILLAMSEKEEDEKTTVFYLGFEDLDNILLPPPFSLSLFQQQRFFTAMNSGANSKVFRRSGRITFPSNKSFFNPSAEPSLDKNSIMHLEPLLLEIAKLAQKVAIQFGNELDALFSNDVSKLSLAIAKLLKELSEPIEKLAKKYDFSKASWNTLARVWILEVHRYLDNLLYFDPLGGKELVVTESLKKLVHLNRDALYLYANFMLSRHSGVFKEKRSFFLALLNWLVQEHPELVLRDMKFLPSKPAELLSDVDFSEYLQQDLPALEYQDMAQSDRVDKLAKDFALFKL